MYLAALAPSSSLFAFAAEMCFAVSIVVTNTIAKTAAGESRAMSLAESEGDVITDGMEEEEATRNMRGTITAAVAASFVSGAVLALALALAAGPLLSLMHVPPEVAPVVRTYVAVRALGLPFFAASNAAEGVFIGQRDGVTPMVAWTATGVITLGVIVLAAHPARSGSVCREAPPPSPSDRRSPRSGSSAGSRGTGGWRGPRETRAKGPRGEGRGGRGVVVAGSLEVGAHAAGLRLRARR